MLDNSQLRGFYKRNNHIYLLAVRYLFTDTQQRIVLRGICLVQDTVSLSNVLDQGFRESGMFQHLGIDAIESNRFVSRYNERRNVLDETASALYD